MTKNTLHPQDARTQSILNRAIAARQRYEGKSLHSRYWVPANFIADREEGSRPMGMHRARPADSSPELPCAL